MTNSSSQNPWILKKIVLPQHTDHAGIMWHGSYLNWLEEARVEALSKVGLAYSDLSQNGIEMPVIEINIRYIKSLFHGDQVILKSWPMSPKGIKLPWKTIFLRDEEEPSAEAIVNLVLLSRANSKVRLIRKNPEYISKALAALVEGPS